MSAAELGSGRTGRGAQEVASDDMSWVSQAAQATRPYWAWAAGLFGIVGGWVWRTTLAQRDAARRLDNLEDTASRGVQDARAARALMADHFDRRIDGLEEQNREEFRALHERINGLTAALIKVRQDG